MQIFICMELSPYRFYQIFHAKIHELMKCANYNEKHHTSPFLYTISRIHRDRKQFNSCQELGQ